MAAGIQMDVAKALQTLRAFNKKAEKLEKFQFAKHVAKHGLGFKLTFSEDESKADVHGPDEEMMDAVLLTVRLLIQNNDAISFAKMEKLYRSIPVDSNLLDHFTQLRQTLNHFLDSPTILNLDGEQITHRKVLTTFMYGDKSHLSAFESATLE